MRAAVFFERDGVLSVCGGGNGTVTRLQDFQIREEACGPLEQLRAAGFHLFATTNQPGVTAGEPTRRELDLMHAMLLKKLQLTEVLVCPHSSDDSCPCRKPQPGLLREAARRHGVDLDHSFVVSDRWVDAEMAEAAGATSVLIRSRLNGSGHHDFLVPDLAAAVAKILEIAGEVGTLRAMKATNGTAVLAAAPRVAVTATKPAGDAAPRVKTSKKTGAKTRARGRARKAA